MKLPRSLARFNKKVTNRVQGLYAWVIPPWAVIVHRGRKSGRQYRTPLIAFKRGDTVVIALVYGDESDWLRNMRSGRGHVVHAGRTYVVGSPPEIVETTAASTWIDHLLPPARWYCGLAAKVAILELDEQLPGFGRGPAT